MHVCIAYDCLYPYTVGGHERWLRQLAEALAARGHRVTYLTRRQWSDGDPPQLPGVRVIAVSRAEELYDANGNRHPGQAIRFAVGTARHLIRHRRSYDVVHTCAFPYFHLFGLRLALALTGTPVTVDWPEAWTRAYWRSYSGLFAGTVGELVQWLCVRLTPTAVVTSRLTADRLTVLGIAHPPRRPGGLGPDPAGVHPNVEPPATPVVVFAARHIREKRPGLVVQAVAAAREEIPDLRAVVLGNGPETPAVLAGIEGRPWAAAPGFVPRAEVEAALRESSVMLLPSEREGFGIVVLEAAAYGTPAVVVAGPDNAAVELVEPGVNGFVAADADPATVARALVEAVRAGAPLRQSTADWYAGQAPRLAGSETARAMETLFAELVGPPDSGIVTERSSGDGRSRPGIG